MYCRDMLTHHVILMLDLQLHMFRCLYHVQVWIQLTLDLLLAKEH